MWNIQKNVAISLFFEHQKWLLLCIVFQLLIMYVVILNKGAGTRIYEHVPPPPPPNYRSSGAPDLKHTI